MTITKSKYITNTAYYTFIPLLRTAINFIMLPFLTRYLTPIDYGKFSLLTLIVTLFFGFFTVCIHESSCRYYFKYKGNQSSVRTMLSTNLIFILVSLSIGGILLLFLFSFINNFYFKNELRVLWLILIYLQFSLLQINMMNQYIFQNRYEGKIWFKNELTAILVHVPLTVILVISRKFTFEALIISGFVAELIRCIVIFIKLKDYYAFVFEPVFLRESLKYAFPMLPNVLINFLYTSFDKTMLTRTKGISQVGILDISNRIILFLKMIMDGIGSTFSPITMDLLTENSKESLKKLGELNLKLISFLFFIALGIMLFSQEAVILLTTKSFYFTMYVVPIYIYYHVFGVIGMISYWLIRYPGKTVWTIPINIVSLAISLIANILLIPKFGIIGVAIASFLSMGISQFLQYFIGIRLTPIPMKTFRMVLLFITLLIGTGGVYLLYYLNLNFFINIIIKLSLLSIFLFVCLSLKTITQEDINNSYIYIKNKIISKINLAFTR